MSSVHDVLKKYWGYTEFRSLQEDIIMSVLSGYDTLGLMPTGGGKSITFQVPTMMLPGLTLVVTPIISLMKDQVDNLLSRRIKATYMHAGLTFAETRRVIEKCTNGGYKFLYISPERLKSTNFLQHLKQMNVSLIVVDEAHCISQWGYDFRPSFLNIVSVRKLFPLVPMLALTATATPHVVEDIVKNLELKDVKIFSKSFSRPNLSYVVRPTSDKLTELSRIIVAVPGTAIVYVRSRRRCKEISDELNRRGISADYYHAGLINEDKSAKQTKWKDDECRVMVATNAFGMGIDKPDVRLVVHMDIPNSLEEYYQEAGRAGRDGLRSYAVLLTTPSDKSTLKRHITDAFPDKDYIKKVYERMCNFLNVAVGEGYDHVMDFDFNLFCRQFKLPVLPTHNALNILTRSGYIDFVEEIETQSRVMILASKEELYDIETNVPRVDDVLKALLRTYTGLFADYVFINESVISYRFGISQEEIYTALLELTRLHILHYVPRKRIPYIYFTTSREEPRHLLIPKAVYEDLKRLMEQRIDSVLRYAFSSDMCRERILLEYFGDNSGGDCGCCDVCIDRRKRSNHTMLDVQQGILYMTQVKPRYMRELVETLSFPRDEIYKMVDFLVEEGLIKHLDDDTYQNPEPLK